MHFARPRLLFLGSFITGSERVLRNEMHQKPEGRASCVPNNIVSAQALRRFALVRVLLDSVEFEMSESSAELHPLTTRLLSGHG